MEDDSKHRVILKETAQRPGIMRKGLEQSIFLEWTSQSPDINPGERKLEEMQRPAGVTRVEGGSTKYDSAVLTQRHAALLKFVFLKLLLSCQRMCTSLCQSIR